MVLRILNKQINRYRLSNLLSVELFNIISKLQSNISMGMGTGKIVFGMGTGKIVFGMGTGKIVFSPQYGETV